MELCNIFVRKVLNGTILGIGGWDRADSLQFGAKVFNVVQNRKLKDSWKFYQNV